MMKTIVIGLMFIISSAFAGMPYPKITYPLVSVTNDTTGATSLDGLHCYLYKGRFEGTVEGIVVARESVLEEAVGLLVFDSKEQLITSCGLDRELEKNCSIYFFTLSEDLVSKSKLRLFSKEQEVCDILLADITLKTDPLPSMEELINNMTKSEKIMANQNIEPAVKTPGE